MKGGGEAAHPHSNGVFGPWWQNKDGSVGHSRSEKRSDWKPSRIFGIGKEDGKRIIGKLGCTLLDEHEKLFGSSWWHTFGLSSSLFQLLGKDMSVSTSVHGPTQEDEPYLHKVECSNLVCLSCESLTECGRLTVRSSWCF